MSTPSNLLSVNNAINQLVSQKPEVSLPKWAFVASLVVGLALLCILQPYLSSGFNAYLPMLNGVVAFGFVGFGIIGLVKKWSQKTESTPEENLVKLHQRRRGERLTVEDGKIMTMGIGKKILCRMVPSYRKEENRKLKETIDDITSRIQVTEESPELERAFVNVLFLDVLVPLNKKIYSRNLHESTCAYLRTQVSCEEVDSSPEFQGACASAQFWARLGNFKRPKGGVGGSYAIFEGATKQVLGIYKPYDEDTLAENNPHTSQKIKYYLSKTIMRPFSRLAFNTVGGQAYIAEAAATIVGKFVVDACQQYDSSYSALTLIPETHVVSLSIGQNAARVGSFQLWENEKHLTASQFFGTSRHYSCSTQAKEEMSGKLSDELFDLMVICDYVTGNFDRHGDNWLVLEDGSGVRLIDGGWAMAPQHPTRRCIAELNNLYLWKKLPLADSGFTPLGQSVIDSIVANLDSLAAEITDLYARQDSDGEARVARMRERILVLKKAKATMTKRQLAEIRTSKSIHAHLTSL